MFGVLAVAAFVGYLVLGRNQWFFSDEWDYLVTRSLFSDPASLLVAHNGHWQTLPAIMYRVLFHFFHLSSYLPYQIPVVALHVTTAGLLRLVMRRAGVGPWIATAGAVVFLLLGTGLENIVFAVQVTFLGSLALGLAQLLLADHDGASRRRDVWAVVCSVGAIMCSGVGVTMVGITAVAVLLRRGWKPAVLQAAPAAGLYLLWFLFYGDPVARTGSLTTIGSFVGIGVWSAVAAIAQYTVVAWLLVVVALAGWALRLRPGGLPQLRGALAAPVAMVVGVAGFLLTTAISRAGPFGAASAASARYFALVVALLLPAVAVGVDALARKHLALGVTAVVVLLAGVPGNVATALREIKPRDAVVGASRELILTLPRLPEAATAPGDMRPLPETNYGPSLTVGWLRDALAAGWLPAPAGTSPSVVANARFHLSLWQRTATHPPAGCRPLTAPVTVTVKQGDRVYLAGGFVTMTELIDGQAGNTVTFNPNRGNEIEVLHGPLTLQLSSGGVNGPGQLCQ